MRKVHGVLLCALLGLIPGCTGIDRAFKPEAQPAPPSQPAAKQAPEQASISPADRKPAPPPPTQEQLIRGFTVLNNALKDANERILKARGSRIVPAPRAVAFDALQASLTRLGMIVENRDPEIGVLTVAAPAPRPLDVNEWRTTVQSDLPLMAGILCPIIGEYCRALKFDPDDYVIVINATVLATAGDRSEISLTTRMREIVPRPGMPRREYPPPTGVQLALDKIWEQFDREIAARQGRPG